MRYHKLDISALQNNNNTRIHNKRECQVEWLFVPQYLSPGCVAFEGVGPGEWRQQQQSVKVRVGTSVWDVAESSSLGVISFCICMFDGLSTAALLAHMWVHDLTLISPFYKSLHSGGGTSEWEKNSPGDSLKPKREKNNHNFGHSRSHFKAKCMCV